MNEMVQRLLCRQGFTFLNLAPSSLGQNGVPPNTECIALCGLGCNTKRTGKYPIPAGAKIENELVEAALRHARYCRNAQKRKSSKTVVKTALRPIDGLSHGDLLKQIRENAAREVLNDKTLTSGKQQVRSFMKKCGGTKAQFMRIKYRILNSLKSVPF